MRSRRKEETEREDRRERHRDGKGMWGEKGNRRERHRDGRECGEKRDRQQRGRKERDESHPINTPKTRTQKNTKGALTADSCQCMVKPTTVL